MCRYALYEGDLLDAEDLPHSLQNARGYFAYCTECYQPMGVAYVDRRLSNRRLFRHKPDQQHECSLRRDYAHQGATIAHYNSSIYNDYKGKILPEKACFRPTSLCDFVNAHDETILICHNLSKRPTSCWNILSLTNTRMLTNIYVCDDRLYAEVRGKHEIYEMCDVDDSQILLDGMWSTLLAIARPLQVTAHGFLVTPVSIQEVMNTVFYGITLPVMSFGNRKPLPEEELFQYLVSCETCGVFKRNNVSCTTCHERAAAKRKAEQDSAEIHRKAERKQVQNQVLEQKYAEETTQQARQLQLKIEHEQNQKRIELQQKASRAKPHLEKLTITLNRVLQCSSCHKYHKEASAVLRSACSDTSLSTLKRWQDKFETQELWWDENCKDQCCSLHKPSSRNTALHLDMHYGP